MWFIFHMDLFLRPLCRFWCQSRPFTQSVLGQFPGKGDVALFRDATHHKYSIQISKQSKSRYRNNTSFYSEMSGKHVGEGFVSIQQIVYEIWTCKVEKLLISRKFDHWPLVTRPNFYLGWKNAQPARKYSSRAIRWSFPLSSTTLSLETRRGSPSSCAVEDGEMASAGEG